MTPSTRLFVYNRVIVHSLTFGVELKSVTRTDGRASALVEMSASLINPITGRSPTVDWEGASTPTMERLQRFLRTGMESIGPYMVTPRGFARVVLIPSEIANLNFDGKTWKIANNSTSCRVPQECPASTDGH